MSKQSNDDHRSDRYRFRGGTRRVSIQGRDAKEETDDLETRLNRAHFRKTVRLAAVFFVVAWVICTVGIAFVVHVIYLMDNPEARFTESVFKHLGCVLISGFIGGLLFSAMSVLRRGISLPPRSEHWSHYLYPWNRH